MAPVVPSYPPGWYLRRASRNGLVSINGDNVFVSTALAGQLLGLKQEGLLRWRVRFFEFDLGTIEVAPLSSAFAGDAASASVNDTVGAEQVTVPTSTSIAEVPAS